MRETYYAMQVSAPGRLEYVEKAKPAPSVGEVLIAVEACGICGADASDIERSSMANRVPGHEVVGRIIDIGEEVAGSWQIGQRVGVGRLGEHCNYCGQCRQGRFELCENQPVVGATVDGGYAQMMIARATGLVSIPEELDAEEAAPLLCAGLATFNAVRKSGAQPGDTIAVLGIGGLGHMAIQYAQRMGFRVVALGRGDGMFSLAAELGAHAYIDAVGPNTLAELKAQPRLTTIISTIGDASLVSRLLPALAPGGRLIVLGAGGEALAVPLGQLVGSERSVVGSLTGTPFESERTLDFSVLTGVRPRIETMPLKHAQEAYERMRSGKAEFRIVLTMETNYADQ